MTNQEIQTLAQLLEDDDNAVRHNAILALGKIEATEAVPTLIRTLHQEKDIDAFIIYTDSIPKNSNLRSPSEALNQYNEKMEKNAKLIICAMRSNEFTIADPENPNMLDICGFDKCVPEIISSFCQNLINAKCNVCHECREMKYNHCPLPSSG